MINIKSDYYYFIPLQRKILLHSTKTFYKGEANI